MTPFVVEADGEVRITVRVVPRSTRSGVDGVHGNALKVRLNAPPVDGAANEELIRVLAGALGVPRRNVRLVGGARGRTKTIAIYGVSAESVTRLTLGASRT